MLRFAPLKMDQAQLRITSESNLKVFGQFLAKGQNDGNKRNAVLTVPYKQPSSYQSTIVCIQAP